MYISVLVRNVSTAKVAMVVVRDLEEQLEREYQAANHNQIDEAGGTEEIEVSEDK